MAIGSARFVGIAVLGLLAGGCRAPQCVVPAASCLPQATSADAEIALCGDGELAAEPDARFASLEISADDGESLPSPAGHVRLTLDEAIALSLSQNPDLLAIRAAEPVAHAAFHVAATYPFNPQFQTQVLPYNRDRDGADGSVVQQYALVQPLELAGQRGLRAGSAAADYQRVEWTIRQAELVNIAQTERLFCTALYQRDLHDVAESLASLNEQMVGVIERRLRAGEANSGDVALARLQAQSARRQQRLAEAAYQTALAELRNHVNLDAANSLELVGSWSDWQWQPVDEARLARLVAERPDIVAARAAVSAAEAKLALAHAARTPDLAIGPMWERDEAATEFWGLQAQMDIPVVNTGVPLVRQREAELREALLRLRGLEEKALLQANAAAQRYERARRLVDQSQGELRGAVEDALRPVEDQFKAGQITLLEVFAARTVLTQSRQSLLDLLNELGQAAAAVTEATGLPPQELFGSSPEADAAVVEPVDVADEGSTP